MLKESDGGSSLLGRHPLHVHHVRVAHGEGVQDLFRGPAGLCLLAHLTVGEKVTLPARIAGDLGRLRPRARELLERVGQDGRAGDRIAGLSGGEQQAGRRLSRPPSQPVADLGGRAHGRAGRRISGGGHGPHAGNHVRGRAGAGSTSPSIRWF